MLERFLNTPLIDLILPLQYLSFCLKYKDITTFRLHKEKIFREIRDTILFL